MNVDVENTAKMGQQETLNISDGKWAYVMSQETIEEVGMIIKKEKCA